MEGGDGHEREGGEQRQQQWPPWPGPVLRLTHASQKQLPQPARYDERPVQQPHAQEREVRAQLRNAINAKNGNNERQFSLFSSLMDFFFNVYYWHTLQLVEFVNNLLYLLQLYLIEPNFQCNMWVPCVLTQATVQ